MIFMHWTQHDSQFCSCRVSLREDSHVLHRRGISSNVVVHWFVAEQQVAHASANQVCLIALVVESASDRDGEVLEHYLAFSTIASSATGQARAAVPTRLWLSLN